MSQNNGCSWPKRTVPGTFAEATKVVVIQGEQGCIAETKFSNTRLSEWNIVN